MPRRRRKEVIFEAKVSSRDPNRPITREDEKLKATIHETLTRDLPRELSEIFDLKVEIEIKATRYGSIAVFFGAVFTVYGIIAGYKDFLDSIELIRQQADDLLEIAVRRVRNNENDYVQVSVRSLSVDESEPPFARRRRRMAAALFPPESLPPAVTSYQSRRDGFFFFLLFLCIAALIIIALLVYKAVLKTYFA